MKNQEYIDMQYLANRYLEDLSFEDLIQRTVDVVSNYPTLTADGRIGLRPINHEGKYWFTLFCNIMTEMELRNAQFPDGFLKDAPIPKPSWPGLPRGAQALKTGDVRGDYLFKFGKECHLRPMLEQGRTRIGPASSYDDPSLNKAVQDKELEVAVLSRKSETKIYHVDQANLEPLDTIEPIGNVTFTLEYPSDYFVICLASVYDLRLYDDFPSDSCLVIRDPKRFVERVLDEIKKIMPDWVGRATFVEYYDPLRIESMPSSVFFHKHFRYAYQKEFRIVLRPPQAIEKLQPLFIEIGSLEDYCELICV